MFTSDSTCNCWSFVHNILHQCSNPLFYPCTRSYYSHLFCKLTAIIFQHAWLVSAFINLTFVTFKKWFSYNDMWSCQVVTYRKQETIEYVKLFSGLNSIWLRNKTVIWSLTRGVDYKKWSLWESMLTEC